jgi:hypothetical protein
MRHWKLSMLAMLAAAMFSAPRSASAASHQYRRNAGLPVWLLRLCTLQLRSAGYYWPE